MQAEPHLPPSAAGAAVLPELQKTGDIPGSEPGPGRHSTSSSGTVKRAPSPGLLRSSSGDGPVPAKRVCSRISEGGGVVAPACAAAQGPPPHFPSPPPPSGAARGVRRQREVRLVVSKTRTVRTDVEHFRRLVHELTGSHVSSRRNPPSPHSRSHTRDKSRSGRGNSSCPGPTKAVKARATSPDPNTPPCQPASNPAHPAPSDVKTSPPGTQACVPDRQLGLQGLGAHGGAVGVGLRSSCGEPNADRTEVPAGQPGLNCKTEALWEDFLFGGEDREGGAPTAAAPAAGVRDVGLAPVQSQAGACRDTARHCSGGAHLTPLQVPNAAAAFARGCAEGHLQGTPFGLEMPLYIPSPSLLASLDMLGGGGRAAEREATGGGTGAMGGNAGGAEESWGNQPASPGSLVLWDLAVVLAGGGPAQGGRSLDVLLSDGPPSATTSLSATSGGSAGPMGFRRSSSP